MNPGDKIKRLARMSKSVEIGKRRVLRTLSVNQIRKATRQPPV
jgi:hypothetical protein